MESDKLLQFELLTPQSPIFDGKVISVIVPGKKAPFQVLYDHAPIVSELEPGIVEVKDENDNTLYFAISSGFITVEKNSISIFVDSAKAPNEIEIEKVKQELEELRKAIPKVKEDYERDKLLIKVTELESQLKVVGMSS